MEYCRLFWSEGNENFSSEIATNFNKLRSFFERKIKTDAEKMHNVYFAEFENNLMTKKTPIKSHKIIFEDCKTTKTYFFK